MEPRVAVMVSGSGTNLQTLLDDPSIAPMIALVVSDRPEVRALERASARGVETLVIEVDRFPDRDAFTVDVRDALTARGIDTVVLAGYMRVLTAAFFEGFPGRVLNVHPALLPAFPGAHAVRDALDWGVKVTGVTVHLVDERVDHGPIVLQEPVEVFDGDDWDSLEARIHAVEHRLLPRAVRAMVQDRLVLDGRGVRIAEEGSG
jgi:phosphoribosylglycinamide formyltransferase 1